MFIVCLLHIFIYPIHYFVYKTYLGEPSESGAWDGVFLSNTRFFELRRNWTGLLVEPNKLAFKAMVLRGTRKRSVRVGKDK